MNLIIFYHVKKLLLVINFLYARVRDQIICKHLFKTLFVSLKGGENFEE
jgi:hypothetical protein